MGRTNTCHVPESLNRSSPLLPHIVLPDTPLSVPHPAPHSPLLQELEGIREASKRGSSRRVMVWCGGAGQGQAMALPREPEAGSSTLGEGCRGSPRRRGQRAGHRADTEGSLPPTLVLEQTWADPNLGG